LCYVFPDINTSFFVAITAATLMQQQLQFKIIRSKNQAKKQNAAIFVSERKYFYFLII